MKKIDVKTNNTLKLLKILKIMDKKALCFFLVYAFFNAVIPFINIYYIASITDSVIKNDKESTYNFVVIMCILNILGMLILGVFDSIKEYKMIAIDIDFRTFLRKILLKKDYEEISNCNILEEICGAERTVITNGGLEKFIELIQKQFSAIISMLISIWLIAELCFKNYVIGGKFDFYFVFVFLTWWIVFKGVHFITNFFDGRVTVIIKKTAQLNRQLAYYLDKVFFNSRIGKEIRIYNMKELLINNYKKWENDTIAYYKKIYREERIKKIIIEVMNGSFLAMAYVFVSIKVIHGAASVGEMSKYVASLMLFSTSFTELILCRSEQNRISEYMKIFIDYFKLDKKRSKYSEKIICKANTEDYVFEFKNVSFKYKGIYVLRNINCTFSSNMKFAIVGQNGAGKTTLIKLLCKLYIPSEGEITLNGRNINQYTFDEYIKVLSVVFQDFNIFSFSINKNIASKSRYDINRINDILKQLEMFEKLQKLPKKQETELKLFSDKNISLSGGEMQKLAIARAMYKDAPMLILDEPTSALDPKTEMEIYEKMNEITHNRGCIYISHRMSSCKFCDYIYVLKDGEICEKGSHNELLERQGEYFSLWNAQAKYYV